MLGRGIMETNGVMEGVVRNYSTFESLLMADWGRSPFWQFVGPTTCAICITIVLLAALNAKLLCRRDLLLGDLKMVGFRIAISKYVLIFFGVMWFFVTSASFSWLVSTFTQMDDGEAKRAMLRLNTEPPFIWAIILMVLTGIHSAVGILFETRKKKYKE